MSSSKCAVSITGCWLLKTDATHMAVRLEINGHWVDVIEEFVGSEAPPTSHIVEAAGIMGRLEEVKLP